MSSELAEVLEQLTPAERERFAALLKRTTIQQWHKLFSMKAAAKGEWAGCPLPIPNFKLVVEPRSPYAHLNGVQVVGDEITRVEEELDDSDDDITQINYWYNESSGMHVYIYETQDGRRHAFKMHWTCEASRRLDFSLSLLGPAVDVWDTDTEMQALRKLRSLVTPRAFKCYLLTGMFLETSERSNVTYLFRRSRPTVALTSKQDPVRILAVLCLHPIGYYQGTWAGTMVPTDDVIAHLLLMRGDEHFFWRKANQHRIYDIEAGL